MVHYQYRSRGMVSNIDRDGGERRCVPHGEDASLTMAEHEVPSYRRLLNLPADDAWEVLASPSGARRWFADEGHPGVRVGVSVVVPGAGPAQISAVGPGASLELVFPAGRRAVIAVSANDKLSEIAVHDYGTDGCGTDPLGDAWIALLAAADYLTGQVEKNRRGRQAIVVIHGTGRQQPQSTIKDLLDSLIPSAMRYSKPDTLSSSYELRRYQIKRNRNRPRTDVFELYWADKMPGTGLSQVFSWLRPIAFRRPRDVSQGLRPISYLIRTAAAVSVAAIVLLAVSIGTSGIDHLWHVANGLARVAWITTGLSLAGSIVSGLLVATLGDAARYLDPAPDNISVRQSIRQSGVDLLRRLHSEGHYDRVVVVGHSLGSIIGYDIVRFYWTEVHKSHGAPVDFKQVQLAAYLRLLASSAGSARLSSRELEAHRAGQRKLWQEYRRLGHPWLITDLITVGSPLAHAGTLLARSPAHLEEIMEDRELPTCPPRRVKHDLTQRVSYLVDGQIRTLEMPTFSAPFAVTRWTNIYAPSIGLIFGDPVGGPLAPVFGPGIEDTPVEISPKRRRFSPLAHTSYWRRPRGRGESAALGKLVTSLGIESGRWLKRHIREMPWEMSISDYEADEEP
jgi:hypothetical protein